jgi:hypothetical protein
VDLELPDWTVAGVMLVLFLVLGLFVMAAVVLAVVGAAGAVANVFRRR